MMTYYEYFNPFGTILMILIWALILSVVVRIMLRVAGGGHLHRHSGSSVLQILQERYAKGEINKQEYEEKKKDLSQNN